MRFVITGGTGLLGQALTARLRRDGHDVIVLTRRPRQPGEQAWPADERDVGWMTVVDGADVVINLAGESLAAGRWSEGRKTAIRESRVRATRAVVAAIARAARPPATLISSSAVGFYGSRGSEPLTEESAPGSDFLASVCQDWEDAARGTPSGTRLVLLRTGVVLSKDGGALPQLALPFHLFAGGPLGSGRQFISWIHIADWIEMVRWAVATSSMAGPINATAPEPVTNRDFAGTLGTVLHRPSILPAPAIALRAVLGAEKADAMVLGGQRVLPARALAQGFTFNYSTLEHALRALYR